MLSPCDIRIFVHMVLPIWYFSSRRASPADYLLCLLSEARRETSRLAADRGEPSGKSSWPFFNNG